MSKNTRSTLRRTWDRIRYFFPHCRYIILSTSLGFFASLFSLAGPYLSRFYIDTSFLNRDLTAFIRLSLVGIVIFLFSTLANFIADVIRNKTLLSIKLSLANAFIRRLYTLDLAFFHEKSVGENIYRISNIESIAHFISEEVPRLLVDSLRLVIVVVVALFINARLTVLLFILSPFLLLHSFYLRSKIKPIFLEIWRSNARLSKMLQESLSKMQIIKALNLETFERRFYIRLLIENIRLSVKGFRWFAANSLSSTFLSKAVYGILSLYGGWLIIRGELSLGSYTAVMLYISQAGGVLNLLSYRMEYFVQQGVSMEKFFEVIDSQPMIKDAAKSVRIESIKKEIFFQAVRFGYTTDKPVFNRLDLAIPAGKWLGIVGYSGCGKTTLVKLMLRLYEPQEGVILLDGIDLRTIKIESLRKKISVATQEPFLFDLSVKENICLGLPYVSEREFNETVAFVRLEELLRHLPQGADSSLGENAVFLSQGYKQRIALARAVIRKPDVLILDEATSSIDSAAETDILKALKAARNGFTTIV
ncbi:MAG: ABC transporter ATP-binding protein/permease, partial [Candidatus Omnitrophica bacterium]|nr:ABC transporter ATP-binding protein/permease [Candidatus Omnitrophota bacterium]